MYKVVSVGFIGPILFALRSCNKRKTLISVFCALCLTLPVSAKEVHITLVQANDVYEMNPVNGGRYGGLARLQTLIKQLKRSNPNTYTLLAGDLLSPSAIGTAKVGDSRLNGEQMVAVLNAMDWDVMTFGNHEFDNGREALVDRLSEARFKVISSNVLDATTGKLFPHTQETLLLEVEGVNVGLAGITLRSLAKDFVTIEDPLSEAKKAVDQLRQEQDADVVLLLTHQDLEDDMAFAEQLQGIDLILGGHEHENAYRRRGPDFTPIAKADANARSIYIHQLTYDTHNQSLTVDSRLQIIDSRFQDDAVLQQEIDSWVDKAFTAFRKDGFEPEQLVAVANVPLDGLEASVRNGQTRLTELVAGSALSAFPDSDLSLVNAGGIRIDDVLPPGPVTQYDVIRILPFGGNYTQVLIPGDILQKALDTGRDNQGKGGFLHHANVERSDTGWTVKGQLLDGNMDYRVAIATFLIESGDTGLEFLVNNARIKRLTDKLVDSRFALIDELKAQFPPESPALRTELDTKSNPSRDSFAEASAEY